MSDTWISRIIRPIDEKNWLLGLRYTISHSLTETPHCWSDGDGGFFSIAPTVFPLPVTPMLSENSPFILTGNSSATTAQWSIGEAYINISPIGQLDETREHIAIEFARGINPRSFDVPEVIFFTEWHGLYIRILKKLPGISLEQAWPDLDSEGRSKAVKRIVQACNEMATKKGFSMTGVDGRCNAEDEFNVGSGDDVFRQQPYRKLSICKEIGMDCSTLVFTINCLDPDTVILDLENDSIGFDDWSRAGYFPRDFISTRFLMTYMCVAVRPREHASRGYQYQDDMKAEFAKEGFRSFRKEFEDWRKRAELT